MRFTSYVIAKIGDLRRIILSDGSMNCDYYYADYNPDINIIIKKGWFRPRFNGKYIITTDSYETIFFKAMSLGNDIASSSDYIIPDEVLVEYIHGPSNVEDLQLDNTLIELCKLSGNSNGYTDRQLYDYRNNEREESYNMYINFYDDHTTINPYEDYDKYYGSRRIYKAYFLNNGNVDMRHLTIRSLGEKIEKKTNIVIKILLFIPMLIMGLFVRGPMRIKNNNLIFNTEYKCKIRLINQELALPIDIPLIFGDYFYTGYFIIADESNDKELTFKLKIYKKSDQLSDIFVGYIIPKTVDDLDRVLKNFIVKKLNSTKIIKYELVLLVRNDEKYWFF